MKYIDGEFYFTVDEATAREIHLIERFNYAFGGALMVGLLAGILIMLVLFLVYGGACLA